MLSTGNSFEYNNIGRLKVKGCKNIYHANDTKGKHESGYISIR